MMKELELSTMWQWKDVLRKISGVMNRDPRQLKLMYTTAPWKRANAAPTSLENAAEWQGLKQNVTEYVEQERAKSKGKRQIKPFRVTIVEQPVQGQSNKASEVSGTLCSSMLYLFGEIAIQENKGSGISKVAR